MEALVSIIVAVYNVENYVERCIQSICEQTYKNIEIIIVNDGSTDHSILLLEKMIVKDSRIRLVTKTNGGVSSARNFGISLSSGKYIMFVDGDDFVDNDFVERAIEPLEKQEVDWVNFQYKRISASTKQELEPYSFDKGLYVLETEEDKVKFAFEKLLTYQIGFEVWNKAYRSAIILENNIRFAENCSMGEDLGFNLAYLSKAKTLISLPIRSYNYLIRKDSAMAKTSQAYNVKSYINFLGEVSALYSKSAFLILFIRALENAKREMNDLEIAECVKRLEQKEKDLFEAMLLLIRKEKKRIYSFYGKEDGRVIWRHYLFVSQELGDIPLQYRFYLLMYSMYRKLRGRSPLYLEKHS